MSEINYKEKYVSAMEELWLLIERNLYAFNSFSDSLRMEDGLQAPEKHLDNFYAYAEHPDNEYFICLANSRDSVTTLCELYSNITDKECAIRLNKRGYLEMVEYKYIDGEYTDSILLSGRECDGVVYNKGYSLETHGCGSVDGLNSELAAMGIGSTAKSMRDGAYIIFEERKYIDLGYEFMGGGYGTYIVAENGLKLSLNDHVQYSEETDAENELFDFIDMFQKS